MIDQLLFQGWNTVILLLVSYLFVGLAFAIFVVISEDLNHFAEVMGDLLGYLILLTLWPVAAMTRLHSAKKTTKNNALRNQQRLDHIKARQAQHSKTQPPKE